MADLDIAAFLRARLDEREARARAWERLEQPRGNHYPGECDPCDEARRRISNATDHDDFDDPEFVLADVEAKRQLVELHKPVGISVCDTCHSGWTAELNPADFPCPTLRLLALPYAGHPDYREDWKP